MRPVCRGELPITGSASKSSSRAHLPAARIATGVEASDDRDLVVVVATEYDDLDPHAYDTGVCVLRAAAFGRLWDRCTEMSLAVVADAHVHPRGAWQSLSDRDNPMIARPGHLALILPLMARPPVRRWSVGLYEYLGDHRWRSHGGRHVARVLKIEDGP